MRGASEEDKHREIGLPLAQQELGGSLKYERRLLRFISWLLENLAVFETIVKSEAMVDAPGKFMLP